MKHALIALALLTPMAVAQTQDIEHAFRQHEKTDVPADARFVLIQAPYAAKFTVMLDRYTGASRVILEDPKSGTFWREIKRQQREDDRVDDAHRPNYQIFISRLGLKFTTLLNLRTGASWTLVESKSGELTWEAIPNG